MITNSRFRKAGVLFAVAATISSCAVNLPSPPLPNPADARAAEAANAPLRPTLLATSHVFLSPAAQGQAKQAQAPTTAESYYTCPMHPDIKETKPGNCPICGMTLKSAAEETAEP